jgi:hypothetical protein
VRVRSTRLPRPGVPGLLGRPGADCGTNALELFTGAGFSPRLASAAACAPATFIVGSVQCDLGLDISDPDERRHRRLLYASQDATRAPLLVRHADVLAVVDGDDEFEVGLAALLRGFHELIGRDTLPAE